MAADIAGRAKMVDRAPFAGVYPMLYAFFGAGGGLDRAALRAQVEYCVASGAHGIAVLGLGTEVSKLSADEREEVVAWAADRAWVAFVEAKGAGKCLSDATAAT